MHNRSSNYSFKIKILPGECDCHSTCITSRWTLCWIYIYIVWNDREVSRVSDLEWTIMEWKYIYVYLFLIK